MSDRDSRAAAPDRRRTPIGGPQYAKTQGKTPDEEDVQWREELEKKQLNISEIREPN